jgi:hypothetical protein
MCEYYCTGTGSRACSAERVKPPTVRFAGNLLGTIRKMPASLTGLQSESDARRKPFEVIATSLQRGRETRTPASIGRSLTNPWMKGAGQTSERSPNEVPIGKPRHHSNVKPLACDWAETLRRKTRLAEWKHSKQAGRGWKRCLACRGAVASIA